MAGGSHPLNLGTVGTYICRQGSLRGGDDSYAASIAPLIVSNYIPQGNPYTPLTVSDSSTGTTYKFAGGTLLGSAGQNTATGLLPDLIEDRNGNQINVAQSTTSGIFTFAFTDTLKHTLISDTGFAASPETLMAGGQNYTIRWRTTNANYVVPATGNLSTMGGNCGGVGSVQTALGTGNSLIVISSITLPNGQAYNFYYGDDNPHGLSNPYGLLSEIDYPDGGSVQYTWKFSDQYSDSVSYPAGTGGLAPPGSGTNFASVIPDGCQYNYKAPVVGTRTVFYAGSSPAETQTFTYATTWYSTASPFSKSTSVITNDLITGKSALKKYTYGGLLQGLPVYSKSKVPSVIPVEQSVATYDWGNTTTPLEVKTTAWYDQYEMACEFSTLNGTVSSGHFFQYALGAQVSDDKEYDFAQVPNPASVCTGVGANTSVGPVPTAPPNTTPARETSTTFQTFTSPLGTTFASPQSVTIYSNGTKAAETDFGFDGSRIASVSAVQHDESAFSASVATGRGNVTSSTRKCLGCTDAVTSYVYDETGQMVSSTDACGNIGCNDISGTSHTATYAYTDSPASSSGNTNAYVT